MIARFGIYLEEALEGLEARLGFGGLDLGAGALQAWRLASEAGHHVEVRVHHRLPRRRPRVACYLRAHAQEGRKRTLR